MRRRRWRQRRLVHAPATAEPTVIAAVPPRTDLERRVATIWAEVLGRQNIGVFDSFLDLGGDSLAALRIYHRIGAVFGVQLPLTAIIAPARTVATLTVDIVSALAAARDEAFVRRNIDAIEAGAKREQQGGS